MLCKFFPTVTYLFSLQYEEMASTAQNTSKKNSIYFSVLKKITYFPVPHLTALFPENYPHLK